MDASAQEMIAVDERTELTAVDVPELRRFEARLGPQTIGYTRYGRSGGAIALLHTEIDPPFEGQGLGSRFAAAALAQVLSSGWSVIVTCPFIGAYVRRHEAEYPQVEVRG